MRYYNTCFALYEALWLIMASGSAWSGCVNKIGVGWPEVLYCLSEALTIK